jgi:N-acetylglucosaminyldiphosphoundecaprenol N-acetyl-beta-D-mannosaminyltransferase
VSHACALPSDRQIRSTCNREPLAPQFDKFKIRDVDIAALDLLRASDLIGRLAKVHSGTYVTVTGAHGVVESVYDKAVLVAHKQAFVVVPDGMPLVWLGHRLGFKGMGRVYGPELMEFVFSKKELRELRHLFYGSSPAVIAKLTSTLTARFGAFNMVGSYCPPMRPKGFEEDEHVLSFIRELKPDIIWVGLSTPKQELWLHMHMKKIGSGVGIGVGAAFDLLSGTTRQAPRWIQRSGFEWLFRMAMEPRRLCKRYFFVVPRFAWFLLAVLIKTRVTGGSDVIFRQDLPSGSEESLR